MATLPPGPSSSTLILPVMALTIVVYKDLATVLFISSTTLPGLISILSPTLNLPLMIAPPRIPPFIFSGAMPGLLISKLLAITSKGLAFGSRTGVGMRSSIAAIKASTFAPCWALIGMIGASSYSVPFRKLLIS